MVYTRKYNQSKIKNRNNNINYNLFNSIKIIFSWTLCELKSIFLFFTIT